MKILVLQLARFGDILLTWPTLRALRKKFPDAEIHLLVRKRFAAATDGLAEVDRVLTMDTADLLEPILTRPLAENESLEKVSRWLGLLQAEGYSSVYNLSFSPLSSYITQQLSETGAVAQGYTRTSDGFLAIPDDTSAYFYAQVGVGKSNRYHLAEIFAAVCGVELGPDDWRAPKVRDALGTSHAAISRLGLATTPYIVVHVASSQKEKSYPAFKWRAALARIEKDWHGSILLIGASNEQSIGEEILLGSGLERTYSLIGETSFQDLFGIVSGAALVVGCDSAPIHVASLTSTPCVNLSFATVNFWETGPLSPGSRVLIAEGPETLPSDRVAAEVVATLQRRTSGWTVATRTGGGPVAFLADEKANDDFAWFLTLAIYTGAPFPEVDQQLTAGGLVHLREAATLALEQIQNIENPQRRVQALKLLEQIDLAVLNIHQIVPELRPLIDWFQTERLRIGPGSVSEVAEKTAVTFKNLLAVLNLYLGSNQTQTQVEV